MANKKRPNYKKAAAAANRRARELSDKLRKKSKGRRRSGSGGKIKLSGAGLKRAFTPKAILLGLGGAVLARAGYGLMVDKAPELDDRARAAIAGAAPAVAGMVASGSPAVVIPLAIGGAGVALMDFLGDKLADAAEGQLPKAVSDALSLGVGYAGREADAAAPGAPLTDSAALLALPPADAASAEAAPVDTGVGEIRLLKLK